LHGANGSRLRPLLRQYEVLRSDAEIQSTIAGDSRAHRLAKSISHSGSDGVGFESNAA